MVEFGGAATAAARLLPIAIGSDGGGSTRLPGAYSGVIGMHPTAGLVPSYNPALQMRMNPTVTIGPLARNVTDIAVTLQAMAGPDGRDFDCVQTPAPDMLSHLDDGIAGFRLGWTDDYGFTGMYSFEESPRVITAVREAAFPAVRGLGATIEEAHGDWEDFGRAMSPPNSSSVADRPAPSSGPSATHGSTPWRAGPKLGGVQGCVR